MYWKGTKPCGERFWSKLRLHPLSRETGWLECTLQKGRPVAADFHFAELNRQLAVVPDSSPARRQTWNELCDALFQSNYADLVSREVARARSRLDWRWNKQTLGRRAEMILFRLGLVGRDSEGFE
jgi:hypothetical protein